MPTSIKSFCQQFSNPHLFEMTADNTPRKTLSINWRGQLVLIDPKDLSDGFLTKDSARKDLLKIATKIEEMAKAMVQEINSGNIDRKELNPEAVMKNLTIARKLICRRMKSYQPRQSFFSRLFSSNQKTVLGKTTHFAAKKAAYDTALKAMKASFDTSIEKVKTLQKRTTIENRTKTNENWTAIGVIAISGFILGAILF